jgi:hypothetical protein
MNIKVLDEQKMNKERFQDKESNMLFGQAKNEQVYFGRAKEMNILVTPYLLKQNIPPTLHEIP